MIKSLCIVDDNEIDVYQVERISKKYNLAKFLYSFCDGQEAIDHFSSFEDSKKKFNSNFPPIVILLDINMPRMNGIEFLEEYSKLPKEMKDSIIIIMYTSSDQERDKKRVADFPEVKGYIVKPFAPEHVEKILSLAKEN
jgi:CheY-like chemotaxis protein